MGGGGRHGTHERDRRRRDIRCERSADEVGQQAVAWHCSSRGHVATEVCHLIQFDFTVFTATTPLRRGRRTGMFDVNVPNFVERGGVENVLVPAVLLGTNFQKITREEITEHAKFDTCRLIQRFVLRFKSWSTAYTWTRKDFNHFASLQRLDRNRALRFSVISFQETLPKSPGIHNGKFLVVTQVVQKIPWRPWVSSGDLCRGPEGFRRPS